jgi:hypothetical protein
VGNNNAVIEGAARLVRDGGDREKVLDYLRETTAEGQGRVLFSKNMSRIKINNKEHAKTIGDEEPGNLECARDSQLIFLGNRQAKTNTMSKFNGSVTNSFDADGVGRHGSRTPQKEFTVNT